MSAFADASTLSHEALEEGTVFAPRFGADGLVTAVATDAAGTVLMVAHMNAEALSRTLETGEVHYYSRSRGKLWKKGETSGEIQKLIELRVDCDQDALLAIVASRVSIRALTSVSVCFPDARKTPPSATRQRTPRGAPARRPAHRSL